MNAPWGKFLMSVWNFEYHMKTVMSIRGESETKDLWKHNLKQAVVVLQSSRKIYSIGE